MDEELYDEFGNYIGPDISSDEDDDEGEQPSGGDSKVGDDPPDDNNDDEGADGEEGDEMVEDAGNAIVLAEDKKYYPTAEEVYGEGTEALVEEEDAQPITEPIIAPIREKRIDLIERDGAEGIRPRYSEEYLAGECALTVRPSDADLNLISVSCPQVPS